MTKSFFLRDTRRVARDLLGMEIVRVIGATTIRAVITETEAYYGFRDKASHASRGKTKRNEPMFAEAGTLYVYLIYGMHYCLNIVTGPEEYPAAVLVRGIRLLSTGADVRGPGRVTKALRIDKTLNRKNLFTQKTLTIGKRIERPKRIQVLPRVGVGYAEEWALKPLRYLVQ